MVLSLMPEHEYRNPEKRDEFNRTTRRLLHSVLTGIINAGGERSESIKLSLAEDMNAKRQQRGVEVGGRYDPHQELYHLEQKIADARKAVNGDEKIGKKGGGKARNGKEKKKKGKISELENFGALRDIESLENRAQELRTMRVEKDSAEALEDIRGEYGWLGEAALVGLRVIYPERTRAIANMED